MLEIFPTDGASAKIGFYFERFIACQENTRLAALTPINLNCKMHYPLVTDLLSNVALHKSQLFKIPNNNLYRSLK